MDRRERTKTRNLTARHRSHWIARRAGLRHVALLLTVSVCTVLASCRSEYYANTEPGLKGEAGSDLQKIYSHKFSVQREKYFEALDAFYSFSAANEFELTSTGKCFDSTIDIRILKLKEPCIALWAARGAPTKAHMTFTVIERNFFEPDRRDYLKCQIEIFINDNYQPVQSIGTAFQEQVEPRLNDLGAAAKDKEHGAP